MAGLDSVWVTDVGLGGTTITAFEQTVMVAEPDPYTSINFSIDPNHVRCFGLNISA